MRKFNSFLLLLFAVTMSWTGAFAQDKEDTDYKAALAAIESGANYRIKTDFNGTSYYVTTAGKLTSVKDEAGIFTITKTEGGYFGTGFRIDSGSRFTNPPLSNNVANLTPGVFSYSTNDRADWERQIFYLNSENKYAIRSCNCADGTSSWNDAARTHWTCFTVADVVTPRYQYDRDYIWTIEGPIVTINVTYKLFETDGTTQVSSSTVKQESNSEVVVPASMLNNNLYDYEITGTIGESDSEIKIVRTLKTGVVHALGELSNSKAYIIGCDRGAFLTKNGYLASTAHSSLNSADPSEFAVINYEDNYYLFSVADNKFVTNNGSLQTMLVNGTADAFKLDPKTDPYFLGYFVVGGTNNGLNTNGNDPYGYVINTWMTADPGNQYFMVEAGDFDPEFALNSLNATFNPEYFVTYVVKDPNGNVLFTSEATPVIKGMKITSLPSQYQRPFTTYNEVDVTVTEKQTTVEFTATWDGPFQLSTSDEDAKWYNMTIRSDYNVFVTEEEPYYPKTATTFQKADYEYQWAFAGNAYTGIKVFSRARGFGYTLTKDGDAAVMREGQYTWTIGKNADGFTLKETGTDYNCINQSGGTSGPLKFWNSANSPTDNGSTFRISAVPTSFEWTISDAGYATMYVPVDAVVNDPNAIPAPVGAWTFNDGTTDGTGIATLTATEGVTFADGAAVVPADDYLKMTTNANGALTTYTFMMDVKVVNENKGKYTALYQNKPANDGDGSLFFLNDPNKGRGVGLNYCGMGYGANGSVELNKMQRVVFVCEDGVGAVYLDGVLAAKATSSCTTQPANKDHWTMRAAALFFADNDGEANDIVCDELCFWDKALTAEQVAALGTVGTIAPEETDVEAFTGIIMNNVLKLEKIEGIIPANTPVVLKGTPNKYNFGIATNVLGLPHLENDLLGADEDIEATGKYVLAKPEGKPVGFYLADKGTIKAGKAYLENNSNTGPLVKAFYFTEEAETAIENVNANVNVNEGVVYDLNGRRVSTAQKGIYIINGKKVLK